MHPKPSPWQDPTWLASAHDWIRLQLAAQSCQLTSEISQPHIRPWSTVLHMQTNQGVLFFKASAPYFGHESALTTYLSELFPPLLPDLLACDQHQHWLLMRDSGTPLRASVKQTLSVEPWRMVVPAYTSLQKALIPRVADLLSLGVLDRRLTNLPARLADLLNQPDALLTYQPDGLELAELTLLRRSLGTFEHMCTRLANLGIPETLHHDDFHDGNIFLQPGRIIFTDWGESAITHPFFSLVVMLRSLENTIDLPPTAPELETLRSWYLQEWSEYAAPADLRAGLALAEQIGYINRALTWNMLITNLPEHEKPAYRHAVPAYLKEFLSGLAAQ